MVRYNERFSSSGGMLLNDVCCGDSPRQRGMVFSGKLEKLRELRRSAIDPVRMDARHVERGHDPLRFAEIAPADTADFKNCEPLRQLREHLMRKIDLLQALVELGHCSGLGPSGEKRS